ncbi:hypothetical protein A9K75_06685 [Campylobacter fetus subsp. testudinum]|uniref:hypothetical protein n=1 Tax=Campylobacter fetus TaxID=196 RepID=UPI000818873B|nr:hypothetical protein [Campylobacter fetus]OCR99551.1 hypothetical protein A9K75_06685 [Campylobacter fetus subsp. testudinum]
MRKAQLNRLKIGRKVLLTLLFLIIAFGSIYIWYFGIFINENVIGIVKIICLINIILLCVLFAFIEYNFKTDEELLDSFKKLKLLDVELIGSEIDYTNTQIKIISSISHALSHNQKLLEDGKIEAVKMANGEIISQLEIMLNNKKNLLKDTQSAKIQ